MSTTLQGNEPFYSSVPAATTAEAASSATYAPPMFSPSPSRAYTEGPLFSSEPGQVVNNSAQGGQLGPAFTITSPAPRRTPTPTPSTVVIDPQSDQGDGRLSGGAKAGIAVGAVVAATLLGGLAWVLWKKYVAQAIASRETWDRPELSAEQAAYSPPPAEMDGIPVVREADSRQIIWEPNGRTIPRDGSDRQGNMI